MPTVDIIRIESKVRPGHLYVNLAQIGTELREVVVLGHPQRSKRVREQLLFNPSRNLARENVGHCRQERGETLDNTALKVWQTLADFVDILDSAA